MPLISVKRLCDSDLEVHFKAKQVTVTNHLDTTVLAGALDPKTELYMIHLHDQASLVNSDALPRGTHQHLNYINKVEVLTLLKQSQR